MAMNKGTRSTRTRRTKTRAVLPGEPNPSGPDGAPGHDSTNTGPKAPGMPGGKPRPMPSDPSPVGRYNKLKKAFNKPGMQPGEKEALTAISKKRGVSLKRAAAIGKMRTGLGLTTAGISGPGGMTLKKAPTRSPVKNPKPLPSKPDAPPDATTPKPKMPARKMPVKLAGRMK